MNSYQDAMNKRRLDWAAQEPVEYSGGPVYSDDLDKYFENLDVCVDEYWDDDWDAATALVFECDVERAPTPDLAEYVSERWFEEIEDGYDMDLPRNVEEKLKQVQEEIAEFAPLVWQANFKRRLVFDYSGYPETEDK